MGCSMEGLSAPLGNRGGPIEGLGFLCGSSSPSCTSWPWPSPSVMSSPAICFPGAGRALLGAGPGWMSEENGCQAKGHLLLALCLHSYHLFVPLVHPFYLSFIPSFLLACAPSSPSFSRRTRLPSWGTTLGREHSLLIAHPLSNPSSLRTATSAPCTPALPWGWAGGGGTWECEN